MKESKIKISEIQARCIIAACNDRLTKLTLKFGGKKKQSQTNAVWFENYQSEVDLLISTIEQIEQVFPGINIPIH